MEIWKLKIIYFFPIKYTTKSLIELKFDVPAKVSYI